MARRYWLFKAEPEVFSVNDLENATGQTTYWDGVRNYQARNMLRDEIKKGDGVIFYQSNTEPLAAVATCEIVREGYPDHTQFDESSPYFDSGSSADNPRWYMVDIRLNRKFTLPVTIAAMRAHKLLSGMKLLQKGNRLSVMPLTAVEWKTLIALGGL